MIGVGLSGGGLGEQALVTVGILGTDRMLSDLRRLTLGWQDVSRAQNSLARSAAIQSNWGTGLIAGATLGTLAMGRLGASSLKAAAQLEATKTGLESVLGSAEKAKEVYGKIAEFSLLSPMNNAEVAKSAQLLLATGTAAERLIPTLHAIGNAVAFTGAANPTQKFVEITRVFARLGARGRITARELGMIATRGIDPYRMLQKELKLTGDQVANIGREGITAAQAIPALIRGFEKLGEGQAMERLNKTYTGQVAKLQDAVDQLKAALGSIVLPDATRFVSGLGDAAVKAKELAEQNPGRARIGLGLGVTGIAAMYAGGTALKWGAIGKAMAAGAASGGGVGGRAGGRGVVAKDVYIVAGRVFLSGPVTGAPTGSGTRPLPVPAPGAPGAPGAGGAGGGAAAAGWRARLGLGVPAFGALGPVATGALLTGGAVAAYKTPGYISDATSKSDDDLGQSSDPMQQLHLYGGDLAQRLQKRLLRGASVMDKMSRQRTGDISLTRAQEETTAEEDKGSNAGNASVRMFYNSRGYKQGHALRQWQKDLPAALANAARASEQWHEENVRGYRAAQKASELAALRLGTVSNNGLRGLARTTATDEQVQQADRQKRRAHLSGWARKQFGERLGGNYMQNWDKENPDPSAAAKPRQDWDANTVRLAAAFGQGPSASGVAVTGQRNRDDTLTIQASNAEVDHRNLRGRNMVTPRRLP